jgi:hypothetical protein
VACSWIDRTKSDLTIVDEPGEDSWVIASSHEVTVSSASANPRGGSRYVIDALRPMLSPEPGDVGDQRERKALHLTIAA